MEMNRLNEQDGFRPSDEKPFDTQKLMEYFSDRARNGQPYTFDELFQDFCKHYYLENDRDYFDVIVACLCDRFVNGTPLWLYAIAPSGGTKSTMAQIIGWNEGSFVYMLDSLTSHTLISGKPFIDPKTGEILLVKGLLPQIDGRVLVVKDFSTILSQHPEHRGEIFGQFRSLYDGQLDFGFGTSNEKISIKATIGVIIFTLPIIDNYAVLEAQLGTRFIRIRHRVEECRRQIMRKAREEEKEETKHQLNFLLHHYVQRCVDFKKEVKISDEWVEKIDALACYVAYMRRQSQGVQWYKGDIYGIMDEPTDEIPTRLFKQLLKLGKILTLIRGRTEFTEKEWNTLVRVGEDTIMPNIRSRILTLIRQNNYEVPNESEMEKKLGVSRKTISIALKLMEGCYIVEELEGQMGYRLSNGAMYHMMQVYEPEKLGLQPEIVHRAQT